MNVHMLDQEKAERNVDLKKQRPDYNPYETEEVDEYGNVRTCMYTCKIGRPVWITFLEMVWGNNYYVIIQGLIQARGKYSSCSPPPPPSFYNKINY